MAVANTKSTGVTNADATPLKRTPARYAGGRERCIVETLEVAVADDNTSVYRLARVHSSWAITSIILFHDAITAGTDYDCGLHETAENGSAVKDYNAYADAIDLSSAATSGVEIMHEARDVANIRQQVFADAGESADTNRYYDLTLTGVTVGSAAGTISAIVRYMDGS